MKTSIQAMAPVNGPDRIRQRLRYFIGSESGLCTSCGRRMTYAGLGQPLCGRCEKTSGDTLAELRMELGDDDGWR